MTPPDLAPYLGPELLEQLGDAVSVIGPDWRYRYVSPSAAELIGRPAEECVGALVWDLFPEALGTPQHEAAVRAMEQRTRARLLWHFDTVGRWYEQHALPVADGLVVYVHDVTERIAEVARAEQLVSLGGALAEASTVAEVNTALADHVHPLVDAVGGTVVLADEERGLLLSPGWTAAQGGQAVVGWEQFPSDAMTPSALAHRSGQPVFADGIDDVRARFPAVLPEFERLGIGSAFALPLVSAGVRLGAWALLFRLDQRVSEGDRRFLTTVAAMVAQALLRARLLDAERRAIASLQRNLLPRTVEDVPGLDLAVRYVPSDAAVALGGDWYDVVRLAPDVVGLVMGDVEGHDVEAAAAMGLVRSAVRAYAAEGHPPAVVLQLANRFVTESRLERLVTLTYAALHPADRLVTTVSAGHLPLQVVGPDGVHTGVPTELGPPLGVHADGARWAETTSALPAGGVLLAFTDGLVERRGQDLAAGLGRVRDALVASRDRPVEEVADALLACARSGDDVALLVARLTADDPASGRRTTRRLPATPASVALARRSTRQLLQAWQVEPDVVEAAELVVSELVTNAARHSEDAVDVVLSCPGSAVRLEVTDTSHRMPAEPPDTVPDDATSGRGLLIVDALADRWGVQSEGLGKRVWAELDRPAS